MDIQTAKAHLRIIGFVAAYTTSTTALINPKTGARVFLNGNDIWRVSHFSSSQEETEKLVDLLNGPINWKSTP